MTLKSNKDRFDLEQEILECWRVTDDLGTLLEVFDREHTEDEVLNIIIGLRALYEQKFATTFETFEQCIRSNAFGDRIKKSDTNLF